MSHKADDAVFEVGRTSRLAADTVARNVAAAPPRRASKVITHREPIASEGATHRILVPDRVGLDVHLPLVEVGVRTDTPVGTKMVVTVVAAPRGPRLVDVTETRFQPPDDDVVAIAIARSTESVANRRMSAPAVLPSMPCATYARSALSKKRRAFAVARAGRALRSTIFPFDPKPA